MELTSLKPLFDRPGPWASVYVDTSRDTEDARQQQELRIRAVADKLAAQGADPRTREAVTAALDRAPVSGAPPGTAVFAAGGEVVLTHPLTRSPAQPDTSWSVLPHLGPLVDLAEDEPVMLVARIDRGGAAVELRTAFGREPKGEVRGEEHPLHRTGRGDWSAKHFDSSVENTWDRNAALVAEELLRLCGETGAEVVVLAGDPRERRAVHEKLERAGAPGVLLETGAEPREAELALAYHEWRRGRLDTVLDRFRSGRRDPGGDRHEGSGPGAAAEGVAAVLDAARRHQVDTLLVCPEALEGGREVWIGPEPDHVAVRRKEVAAMGVDHPRAARADDALLRSAAATDARVLVLWGDEEGMTPAGGVGAVLRWSDERR